MISMHQGLQRGIPANRNPGCRCPRSDVPLSVPKVELFELDPSGGLQSVTTLYCILMNNV